MKYKDVENRIYSSLESGETLSSCVLDSAKVEIQKRKAPARKPILKYALASIVIAVVALVVALPIVLTQKEAGQGADTQHLDEAQIDIEKDYSMQQYLDDIDVHIATFSMIDENDKDGAPSETDNKSYKKSNFAEVKSGDETIFVKEDYCYNGYDNITLYVLLTDDDVILQSYFPNWNASTNGAIVCDITISYKYSSDSHSGWARFWFNGFQICLTIETQSHDEFLWHIEKFLSTNVVDDILDSGVVDKDTPPTEEYEPKVISTATLDDNFADNCVLVVIDIYHSEINKDQSALFEGIDNIKSIRDLTYIEGDDIYNKKYLNYDSFRQIIKIELQNPSKENVLKMVKQIEQIKGVLAAQVNGYQYLY